MERGVDELFHCIDNAQTFADQSGGVFGVPICHCAGEFVWLRARALECGVVVDGTEVDETWHDLDTAFHQCGRMNQTTCTCFAVAGCEQRKVAEPSCTRTHCVCGR